jgi:C1A family cysteine protease
MTLNTSSYILPPSVDLRPQLNEVEQQENIGACLSNAGASLLEIMGEREGKSFEASRLYLYYWTRNFEARLDESGAYLPSLFEVLQNKGVCLESTWPYDTAKQNVQPPLNADEEAQQIKVIDFQRLTSDTLNKWEIGIETTINNIKHAVASGRPVILGFKVTADFEKLRDNKDWRTHKWDINAESRGGHAVVIIGYDDACQRFLIQNSWGPAWGDGGFFGVPYSYFAYWYCVMGAYCPLQVKYKDGYVWPVAAPGYVKKTYDAARKNAIVSYVNAQLQPVRDAAVEYSVPADEIEQAMKWPQGTWDILKKV